MNKLFTVIASLILLSFTPAFAVSDIADTIINGSGKILPEVLITPGHDYKDKDKEFLDDEPDFLDEEIEKAKEEETVSVHDPLYLWNRSVFYFNDKLYFWIMKPVAQAYSAVVPRQVRSGLHNFFYNIEMPVRLVNCILQGKFEAAGDEFASFIVNSIEGILGFDDPAKNYPELQQGVEDLGQTLGSYGIGNGIYIVWPLLGSSTLRDTIGMFGDRFLKPVSYIEPVELSMGITGLRTVNATSFRIGDYEAFKKAALEPYESMRNAYIQNRQKKILE
jgi:phospholipid-binding lipoprotein MlaA